MCRPYSHCVYHKVNRPTMALPQSDPITEAEYLAIERTSDVKHEYAAGDVTAMTGATWHHNAIVGNVITALNVHLRETPCVVSASDMRVTVAAASAYRYPTDTHAPTNAEDPLTKTASGPSTQRREKMLQETVLLRPVTASACHRTYAQGQWCVMNSYGCGRTNRCCAIHRSRKKPGERCGRLQTSHQTM